jgi:hypothetical protein
MLIFSTVCHYEKHRFPCHGSSICPTLNTLTFGKSIMPCNAVDFYVSNIFLLCSLQDSISNPSYCVFIKKLVTRTKKTSFAKDWIVRHSFRNDVRKRGRCFLLCAVPNHRNEQGGVEEWSKFCHWGEDIEKKWRLVNSHISWRRQTKSAWGLWYQREDRLVLIFFLIFV